MFRSVQKPAYGVVMTHAASNSGVEIGVAGKDGAVSILLNSVKIRLVSNVVIRWSCLLIEKEWIDDLQ